MNSRDPNQGVPQEMSIRPNHVRIALLSIALLVAVATGYLAIGPAFNIPAKAAPVIPDLAPIGLDPGSSAGPLSGTFAPVVENAAPAVVSITTSAVVKVNNPFGGHPFFGQPNQPTEQKRRGAGSGVIVTPDGYIVTNAHVVEGAQQIEVSLGDKRSFPAEVIGSDPKTDIAVLKVDAAHLPALPLGNSDNVKVGDIVLAIGNPFGIGRTVTMGIVGAIGRGGLGIEDYEDFIQTDAAINPGNSGGALVNASGQLVGINTAILSRTGSNNGVGFAVPVNLSHHVMSQILEHGEVRRGFLGVGIQDLTPAMAKAFQASDNHGAVVSDVTPGSPAAKAGLERGDVIVALNKKPVEGARQLRLGVAAMAPGSEVDVRVMRDGEPSDIPVTLGRFPGEEQKPLETSGRKTGSYGLSVTELTPEIARELDLAPDTGGVVVAAVQPGSTAAEAGIQRGDLIQEVGRKPLNDVSSFREAIRSNEGDSLLLLVNRGGRTFYQVLEPR